MNQPAGNPSPVPPGRRGARTRRPSTWPDVRAAAPALEPASEQLWGRRQRPGAADIVATVATIPAPPAELDAATGGRATNKRRGVKMAAFFSSGWVGTSAALILIIGTAALVRFAGLSQIGFNSDEAVYSGQAAAI